MDKLGPQIGGAQIILPAPSLEDLDRMTRTRLMEYMKHQDIQIQVVGVSSYLKYLELANAATVKK
jgi:hypothetical protein